MKGELERGVDMALAGGSILALAGLAFVSVAREGLETVLFLFAIGSSSGPAVPTLLAALAGLAGAVVIGWAIFAAGIRVDLRRFFNVTGIVLIFVSAGLVAFAVHEFGEAGLIDERRVVVRPRRRPPRIESARRAPGRPVRLPVRADAARGARLSRLPDPGPDPVRVGRPPARCPGVRVGGDRQGLGPLEAVRLEQGVVRQDPIRAAVGHDPAVVHHDCPAEHLGDEAHVVGITGLGSRMITGHSRL